ncbi:carboxymuconolactone decarboxylase family protein [Nonomuraea diastatica]|uniref:Carboxymuconolactone decarboxylase family protein n=1 Tax=Nonomuraea diastatica TaxID=1848329 RepID=A0A4R4WA46_9ACTN|nr:carboxymuconolactone decarboxylase family protein [Nonomuraea diastatica]TDD14991.1 carboxymuconolactone decarboxylase family protein [Nonomuraea diastatica]
MPADTTAGQDDLKSRLPDPSQFVPELWDIGGGMTKAQENGSISPALIALVQLRLGQHFDSTYHTIGQTRILRALGESEERITAVATWRDTPRYFTEAEQVALELVDATFTPNPAGERVPDELFARACAHYDDRALVTLCMALGRSCFFIPLTLIGKPIAGRPAGENWTR